MNQIAIRSSRATFAAAIRSLKVAERNLAVAQMHNNLKMAISAGHTLKTIPTLNTSMKLRILAGLRSANELVERKIKELKNAN